MNTTPGKYPLEDFHAQYYWKARALEAEVEEQEEYARQCSYELEQALLEYYQEEDPDNRWELYVLTHNTQD